MITDSQDIVYYLMFINKSVQERIHNGSRTVHNGLNCKFMARVINIAILNNQVDWWVGEYCYRIRGDKTFIAKRPVSRKAKIPPPTQQKTNNNFRMAVAFGKYAKADPEPAPYMKWLCGRRTQYKSVYHAALRDAMTPPELFPSRNNYFEGKPGQTLGFLTKDIIPLAGLRFSFQPQTGRELEAGMAKSEQYEGEFTYTCNTQLEDLDNLLVVVTAIDRPGRVFPEEFPFPQQTFRIKDFMAPDPRGQ